MKSHERCPRSYRIPSDEFVHTIHTRRLFEFLDAVREERCLGLVTGPSGVGKSITAQDYELISYIDHLGAQPPKGQSAARALYMLADVLSSPRGFLRSLVERLRVEMRYCTPFPWVELSGYLERSGVQLVLIDEAERLSDQTLEVVRDLYDRSQCAMVFIGMPGLEHRLSRFPQLSSRIGFRYQFPTMTFEQMCLFLTDVRAGRGRMLSIHQPEPTRVRWKGTSKQQEALREVHRLTHGNPRQIQRLLAQADRLLRINHRQRLTVEVVQAAARCLLLGKPE